MHQCIKFILFWNDTLHVQDRTAVCLLADSLTNACCCMCSFELLLMDGKTVRNTQSVIPKLNKFDTLVHLVGFTIEMVFLYFVFRYSTILIISAFYVVSICTAPLPSFLFVYIFFMSAVGRRILYVVSAVLVFLSISLISSNLQLMIPNLCLNTGTSSAPIAVILFLSFSQDFSIILNLLVYSFFTISFIC